MMNTLTLLGTKGGPAIRPGGPNPTSMLLTLSGRRIVIDCGLGVSRGLVEAGMSLKELDLVFITHLHSDHVLELGPLIHTAWTTGLNHKVIVYGPAGTRAVWAGFLASLAYDIETRIADEGRPDLAGLVEIIEYGPGEVLTDQDLTVTALRVDHPPVTDCFALKFVGSGKTIVFSADTAPFPPLADFALGADLLVHEAMLPEGLDSIVRRTGNGSRLREHLVASHSFAADAAQIAAQAGVGMLVLNHLIPADDPAFTEAHWRAAVTRVFGGSLVVGRDGLVISL
ncbi:MBL fold metallo-hydrolase [Rhizobium rosettiformans]|uniref:MBL fold metallo-hydrolase n=2 Tax=Rhizobium rosettiformans TaxID=1368430 RepID=A0A4S8PU03_9HYPH|nr:MBL fold metallo-hydrolase [Rhizobium rosettiformans]MBB5277126.1 ribonuclease BN (tRNA processing enzyme) [Rhizobium rosettiformans]MDR7027758.1 ribonuclease BN (tRNA processing enzyme) [Rhizobium rosettiformans]MDR7066322.1 ribonuclease BN (tRNA processing enzyme) [Rhizobium rosettiformans]THV34923.1 MBL fold metallo-hydrolase [Rhizobium rosettiformans W3]